MKKICRFFSFALAIILLLSVCGNGIKVSCFFSSTIGTVVEAGTGSVDVAVENLTLDGNQITNTDDNLNDGILVVNASETFSFTVRNNGRSAINYKLDIEISWDKELTEGGKILVYPFNMSDETIFENLQNGDFSDAVVGGEVLDEQQVQAGLNQGICETLEWAELDSSFSGSSASKTVSKDYAFKLFFYANEEVVTNPDLFNNEFLQVSIIAYADIPKSNTNWALKTQSYFRTVTLIDVSIPVIQEIPQPKTFFVTQTDTIDLKKYAAAYDEADGNLTDKIVITAESGFTSGESGTYLVTYNVRNRQNFPAAPLQITIVVWDFVKIESGNYHSLALTSHGKVYAWGRNAEGQLGNTGPNRSTPQLVNGLDYVIDIAACYSSSYALTSDGQLYAWGHNGYGHLGDGTTSGKNRPVKVSQPEGVTFAKVFAHLNSVGAITPEGDVYTWGYGGYGVLGNGISENINSVPQKIDISNIAALDFGNYVGAALTKDGKLYTWGANFYGQFGDGKFDNSGKIYAPAAVSYFENIKVSQISVGSVHMTAITEDGRLFTWGSGTYGRLGNGETSQMNTPQFIELPSAPKQAVAGYSHSGVITTDGKVYLFGNNSFGKLGTGSTDDLLVPTVLDGISNASYISLGTDNTFVLSGNRVLYGMGLGQYGALGNGGTDNIYTPVKWVFTPPEPY